ncbi:hypothetical protein AQUSIP_06790 [Aquicella siphonis]|uniref:Uncharacterized protein n=1 Tax=Aquicella siphonis TaxID=254247 RepID=A0A5E4PEH9_9COXI|nr:hypothetical protein [Aquicella siphonis]VVC75389.1 hypothetical protein AQUSIP_06790 [Aquicella siphonis]
MPSFLVNYGGPVCALTSMDSQYDNILQKCKDFYGGTPEAIGFTIKGIDVTYYKIGIHRMIKVELPDSVEEDLKSSDKDIRQKAKETKKLYTTARIKAGDFNTTGYKLLGNNCVSAVANILNTLDSSILGGEKKIIPQFLDSKIAACTKVQSMVHEVLNPPPSADCSDEVIPTKKFYSGGVPNSIWQQAMTTVSKSKNKPLTNQDMKKDIDESNGSPDDQLENEIKFKS